MNLKNEKNSKNFGINDLNNNEEEENEVNEKLELITLNNLSICQICKNEFDNDNHIPYLFKCGHFFCKNCITNELMNSEKKIECPNHGIIANSLKELKKLSNFIINKEQKNKNTKNFCKIHKGIELTHVIEGTKKIFCIYCAIDLCKKEPNIKIKEINEIYTIYKKDIENILRSSYDNIQKIKSILDINNKEKNNEIQKIKIYFQKIIEIINIIQNNVLKQYEFIEKKNTDLLNNKTQLIMNIINQCNDIKKIINNNNINNLNYMEIFDAFSNVQKAYDENKNIINDIDKKLLKYNNIFDKRKLKETLTELKNIKKNNNDNKNNDNKIIKEKNNDKLKLKEYLDKYKKKGINNNNYYYSYNISNINNTSFVLNEQKQNQYKQYSDNKIKYSLSSNKINNKEKNMNKKNSFIKKYTYEINNTYSNDNKYDYILNNNDLNDNNILLKTNKLLYKNQGGVFNFK